MSVVRWRTNLLRRHEAPVVVQGAVVEGAIEAGTEADRTVGLGPGQSVLEARAFSREPIWALPRRRYQKMVLRALCQGP